MESNRPAGGAVQDQRLVKQPHGAGPLGDFLGRGDGMPVMPQGFMPGRTHRPSADRAMVGADHDRKPRAIAVRDRAQDMRK